jgi:hypothetical protein
MAARPAKNTSVRLRTRTRFSRRSLEIEGKSQQKPPFRDEFEVPARLHGKERLAIKEILYFKEDQAPFVVNVPAQAQVHMTKGLLARCPG